MPAPTLGQHNNYVLIEILGMTEKEVKQLAEKEIIGTMPKGWPYLMEGDDEADKNKKFLVADHGSGVTEALEKQKGIGVKDIDADLKT